MNKSLQEFIPHLKCPVTGKPLEIASIEDLEKLNALDNLSFRDGTLVTAPINEALKVSEAKIYYPVSNENIVFLLENQALSDQYQNKPEKEVDQNKQQLMNFYDEVGWQKDDDDTFSDNSYFEDHREVAATYWSKCDQRVGNYLNGGEFLLDVASGAVSHQEYLDYGKDYRHRICMDFSIAALKAAAEKVNNGIFILGDVTNIPIQDQVIDSVVSMHTLYHVPQQEQDKAVAEMYRVIKPNGEAVIIYSWLNPPLMKGIFSVYRKFLNVYKQLKGKKQSRSREKPPQLFVQQQDYDWYQKNIQNSYQVSLKVFSAISRSFSFTFIRNDRTGRFLTNLIFKLENLIPSILGKYGQYPIFLIKKSRE